MKGAKYGGRTKGTPNKTTKVTRELIAELTNEMLPTVMEKIKLLAPKDYVATWIKLNEFILPKPQIDVSIKTEANAIDKALSELAKEND